MDSKPSRTPAEELFAQYLRRVNAGEDVDFQAICRDHPELADELRSLTIQETSRPSGPSGRSRLSPIAREIFERLTGRPSVHGRYKLEGELARGGMGAILRVWDEDLHRHLAMKVVLGRETGEATSADALDAMTLGRFLEEAQVTGQLDHPGIVPVHEVGLDAEGHLFFTMKLVKGRDLRHVYALVRDGAEGWTVTRAIGVLMRVCEAMAYAHDKGVVHRDLKPGNVMVGRFGEVYVMDWGLAKVLDREDGRDLRIRDEQASVLVESDRQSRASDDPSSPLLTMDGDVLGTPAYMSPEQAAGDLNAMGPHSDVYSLGAMLYQLLAGRAPYTDPAKRRSHVEVLGKVRREPPEPLAELAPKASAEIVAITEKAMARDPGERYPDMSAFAEDLRAYLEGRVVGAYETGAVAELRKWVRRNKRLAAAILFAVLALVVGLGVSMTLRSEAERQRTEAVRQRKNVMQLSDSRNLERLLERATKLWPIHPDLIEPYEQWLREAEELVAKLDGPGGHREQLEELRKEALPLETEELEELMASDPRYERLRNQERRLTCLEAADRVRTGAAEPAVFVPGPEVRSLSAATLNDDLAWDLVDPDRERFGREAEGLELARMAVEKARAMPDLTPAHLCNYLDTLAWGYFANGMDANARSTSEEALDLAPDALREKYTAALESIERAIELAQGEAGERARNELAEQVRALRMDVSAPFAWVFADDTTDWWHKELTLLVRGLEDLLDPEAGLARGVSEAAGLGIEERLALARRIEDLSIEGDAAQQAWQRAADAIALSDAYDGLEITEQVGLLPLGPDPRSDLWEFAHVASGEVPRRDVEGVLQIDDDTCVVLVLLPGGEFLMGAQSTHPDDPNYDPFALQREGPVHEVALDPYFISKYELTQAQWLRLAGSNPSAFKIGLDDTGVTVQGRNPVERVLRGQCVEFLERIDLLLPTEAQWEFAARAGTDTPWSTGAERESLVGHANIADRAASWRSEAFAKNLDWPEFDDGHAWHAPVGTFLPNPFGLHDVHGNVEEWCLDTSSAESYLFPVRAGDGLRELPPKRTFRIRGGSFMSMHRDVRVNAWSSRFDTYSFSNLGVRPARPLSTSGR